MRGVSSSNAAPTPVAATKPRPVTLISAACGLGAGDPRTATGPAVLAQLPSAYPWRQIVPVATAPDASRFQRIAGFCRELADTVARTMRAGERFVTIGGDHSCAIGTWSGAGKTTAPLGLLWIDAHLDAHTPATSLSGNPHGMPLACLLGVGDPELIAVSAHARLAPGRVCVIGARSFEAPEMDLLRRLGVRVFPMDEIDRRGLDIVFDEALARVRPGAGGIGVTIDLDVIDPREAPGVNTPAPGGMASADLMRVLTRLRNESNLVGVEIAEFNPHRDIDGKTARLILALIAACFPEQSHDAH